MPDDVLTLADRFRRALVANDVAAEKRLIAAYQGLYARVRDLADALVLEIAKDENMTPAQVRRLERYGRLLKTVEGELTDYGAFVKTEMSVAAREAIRMGEANARALVAIAFGDKRLAARFNVLNTAVIEQLLGFLSPEGELYKRLGMLPAYTADQVANAILEGVGLGKNPRTIARGLTNAFGMGLTDSMRMMRTVQIYSYREANRASYIANGDVVQKWIWYADLKQACPSCIAMHGTVHELSEKLNDHHNGHCAMLPLVIGAKNDITPGEDWFKQQSEATQRQILGDGKYEAWKDGKFTFSQLSTTRTDAVYGDMRTTASLKDLLSDGGGSQFELSEQERRSIHSWGVSGKDMRNVQSGNTAGMTAQEIKDAEISLKNFNSAIEKLPKYEGEILRGLHDVPDSVIDNWTKDAVIELNNHQSATSLGGVGFDFAGTSGGANNQSVVWIANQTTGRNLKGLTNVTYGGKTVNEAEILMTKGSKYKIVDRQFWVKDTLWDDAKIDWYFEGTEYNHANMPDGFRLDHEFRGYYKLFLEEVK